MQKPSCDKGSDIDSNLRGSQLRLSHPIHHPKRHVLVTGPSGSGKTYLSAFFQRAGLNAYDADTVHNLADWYDAAGNRILGEPSLDQAFLETHAFLWNRQALISFLDRQRLVYLFGISRNALDMSDLFDKVYFLTVPSATGTFFRPRLVNSAS